ncbi:pilus assembly protein [Collinsella sp. AGMB00827]|uniref:Pilus assembly protein n=1 Tax=Collinsella ureilytica TaxID=2869515 RepID=A0ABS7MIV6_9ACTN|nr:TadE/TadG family type IV pilus assembly protein [Collinsella urealyticum]MBY4797222.1 pilus assembly protein [Collinsella urealyticum]
MSVNQIWRENRGQATVEMALVAPVLIVCALIVWNLMIFVSAVARFDRTAPDLVLAHGASPVGGEGAAPAASADVIRSELVRAMDDERVEIEVSVDTGAGQGAHQASESILALVGTLRTYRCTLRYIPWPQELSIAGVDLGAPAVLSHTREIVIDPWRPGVVI